jgi:hypothetical protein
LRWKILPLSWRGSAVEKSITRGTLSDASRLRRKPRVASPSSARAAEPVQRADAAPRALVECRSRDRGDHGR